LKDFKAEIVKNQKLILYGIITLALVFANYRLFLKPIFSSLVQTTPRLNQEKKQLVSDQSMVSNIPRYKTQIEQMREAMSAHNKKFSTEQEISELLKGLSEIAKASGVKIVSIRPHPMVESKADSFTSSVYQKFPISIRAVCGYHQLGVFLNRLENNETFMRISDIKIVSDQKESTQHLVYILVNTYVLSEA
jgi:Tfp pilus assembly protein PilO